MLPGGLRNDGAATLFEIDRRNVSRIPLGQFLALEAPGVMAWAAAREARCCSSTHDSSRLAMRRARDP